MTNFLNANWQNIIMANYTVPEEVLKNYLPKGVELDLYNNKAYVSLVGFMFKNTRIFKIPIPFLGTFEEVNLRFYVKQIINNETHRGVVFINETVPYKAVAWLANKLYKEHYISIPTKHNWDINSTSKKITYQWYVNNKWNSLNINANNTPLAMTKHSLEEFIFEHYYGYTKVSELITEKYAIHHPSWMINDIIETAIDCDFKANYGDDFAFLNQAKPDSVFLAEGSPISIAWKRKRI